MFLNTTRENQMKAVVNAMKVEFESSSSETPQFRAFYNLFKKEFTKELKSVGATDITFSKGHFFISGFFTIGSQAWYFSISDVRGCHYRFSDNKLLYRTATDYKDYRGGCNNYVTIEPGMAHKMRLN